MDSKLTFVEKAVKILEAVGVHYKIIYEDHEYGDLEVVKPSEGIVRRHRYFADKYGYADLMRQMEVGDTKTFIAEPEDRTGLHSSICSRAVTMWGKGSVVTQNDGDKITVLRID